MLLLVGGFAVPTWGDVSPKLRKLYPHSLVIAEELSPEERALVSPTLVTLHMNNASALDVARAAAKQAKLTLVEPPPGVAPDRSGKTIDVHLEKQPLWWALGQAFEGRNDVFIRTHSEQGLEYSVGAGTDTRTHWTVSGPFLLKAAPPRHTGRFELAINLMAEPKLTVLGALDPTDVSVVDQSGAPFELDGGNFVLTQGQAASWSFFNISFRPRDGATHIGRIKGVGHALVEVASDRRRLPATANAEVTVGGMKMRIGEVTIGEKREGRVGRPYSIVLTVADVAPADAERVLQLVRGARADVWDDEFQPVVLENRWPELKNGEVRLRLEGFAIRPRSEAESLPARLQIIVPTKATIVDIPFEFTGIPLPEKR